MKAWLLKFTGFVLQWGGMFVGVMYLYQAWRIFEFPITAKGIALPTFIYLSFMQANMVAYSCLKSDKRMIIGFGSAFVGVATVVGVTLYFL